MLGRWVINHNVELLGVEIRPLKPIVEVEAVLEDCSIGILARTKT